MQASATKMCGAHRIIFLASPGIVRYNPNIETRLEIKDMHTAALIEKTDRHTGKRVYAVTFTDRTGRAMQTLWTTFREEACVWGRIIRQHGYCMSSQPFPAEG
jgi:hypothetical protein